MAVAEERGHVKGLLLMQILLHAQWQMNTKQWILTVGSTLSSIFKKAMLAAAFMIL